MTGSPVRLREERPTSFKSELSKRDGPEKPRAVKVLVADDDEDLLEICSRALRDNGFEVLLATTGNDAVSRFIESRPEVIILDYRMPQGNGLEAAAQILAMKPSAKIIMLTADGTVLEEAERIGIELFLEKPISLKRLLESVYTLANLKPTSAVVSR
jgi:CheY-like chemotaxis protein